VKFVFYPSKLKKQPLFANIFKIQGGKAPLSLPLPTPMYLALSTYNTEFVALAVSTMNMDEWEFLLCKWSPFGLSRNVV